MDDVSITSSNKELIHVVITQLSIRFALKDMGQLRFLLGLEVNFFSNGLFLLSQSKYTKDILQCAQMLETTSLLTLVAVRPESTTKDNDLVDATLYPSLVGSLQYLTFTRPNIQFPINQVCQHFQSPTIFHLKCVKHILSYLKGTTGHRLCFLAQSFSTLTGCYNLDWAGCSLTR